MDKRISPKVALWIRNKAVADRPQNVDQLIYGEPVALSRSETWCKRARQTRKGDQMAILGAEDRSGSLEVVVFPKIFQEVSSILAEDRVIIVTGTAEVTEDRTQIRAESIIPVEEACQRLGRRIGLSFNISETSEDLLFRVKDVLRRHSGDVPTSLIFHGQHDSRWVVRSDASLNIQPTPELLAELREMIGENAVLIERS